MEKKKLLLVAVSVGVVLLIIIGIPLVVISPRQSPAVISSAAVPSPYIQERFSVIEAPELVQTVETIQPAFGTSAEAPPELSTSPVQTTSTVSTAANSPQVTTITVQAPRTAAVPNTRVTTQAPSTTARAAPAPAKAPAKVAEPEKAAPAAATAKPSVARPPVETNKVTRNNYWVQTGAFSTEVRAEGAKESLASKGIASVIDNRDIDGKTWYRVRVGPYVSETEASYWLALVQAIDGFTDSQIRQTPAFQ